jgi:hypothetical protein
MPPTTTTEEFAARLAAARSEAKQTFLAFVEAAVAGDAERMLSAATRLEFGDVYGAGWQHAMRATSRLDSVPRRTREVFLRLYIRSGDHIRQETGDDLVLIKGLRVLLPPYCGTAKLNLYRGQGALEPRKRSYGISWSASREVAESHAQGLWRHCRGGSVVLQTLAAPDAVISRIGHDEDRYGEAEYLVDRRRLRRVFILEEYSQLPV